MKQNLLRDFAALLLISCVFSTSLLRADEGTLDPDFDYLPPGETTIFGQFQNFSDSLLNPFYD